MRPVRSPVRANAPRAWDRAASGRCSALDMAAELWLIGGGPTIGGYGIRVKHYSVGLQDFGCEIWAAR